MLDCVCVCLCVCVCVCVKFGEKQSSWTDGGMFPPISKPSIDGIRKGMPIPMGRS